MVSNAIRTVDHMPDDASVPVPPAAADHDRVCRPARRLKLLGLGAGLTAAGGPLAGSALAATTKTTKATRATKATKATTTTKATAATAPKAVRKVKLGFIALTDAAPIILAKELGYFAERSLDVEVLKQASWPALRDALLTNQIDGAHSLYRHAVLGCDGVGGNPARRLKIAMVLNKNGQGITLHKEYQRGRVRRPRKAKEWLEGQEAPSLAMTFPGGTHDMWLRYWLAACEGRSLEGQDQPRSAAADGPEHDGRQREGYCVGEPWNAVAVRRASGSPLWLPRTSGSNHSEKALVVSDKFAANKDTLKDVMGAIMKASKWLDDPANRADGGRHDRDPRSTSMLRPPRFAAATGVYDLGPGLGTKDFKGDQMQFFRNGTGRSPGAHTPSGSWPRTSDSVS